MSDVERTNQEGIADIERRIAELIEMRAKAVERVKAAEQFSPALRCWPGTGGVDQRTGLPAHLTRGRV